MTKDDKNPAQDNEPDPRSNQYKFEISFKILGNEIIGIKVGANTITNKWLIAGVTTLIILTAVSVLFGDHLMGWFG